MNYLRRLILGTVVRSVANEIKAADLPLLHKFFDLANEMSLTEALNAVGSEFNWPVSSGTALQRLEELGNQHLGDYGPLFNKAVKVFQKQFNTEKTKGETLNEST